MKKYILLFLAIFVFCGAIFAPQLFHKDTAPTVPAPTPTATTTESTPLVETDQPKNTTSTSGSIVTKAVPAPNVTILVASTSYPVYVSAGASVMDAMNALASSHALVFTTHELSGLGAFIDSINGKENGNGKYWFLYINGKSSETGASQTYLRPSDIVEWRYQESY